MMQNHAQAACRLDVEDVVARTLDTRNRSLALCKHLSPEDMQVQSMEDASPAKWHLAHTTWFFETFILKKFASNHSPFDDDFQYLFNSYYNGIGPQFRRAKRGLLTRPSLDRVTAYRKCVDDAMQTLLGECAQENIEQIASLVEFGIQHEQQHQELLLTDIKHAFYQNPQFPSVRPESEVDSIRPADGIDWVGFEGGIFHIGHAGPDFCFDNETPAHRVFVEPFYIASRLSTNAEYLAFIESGGYEKPEFWLSEAWQSLQSNPRKAPLYWHEIDGTWFQFTLNGLQALDPAAPVMHVNYYEADAFARWSGKRLPTEQEWELACGGGSHGDGALKQLFNCLWQWTGSSYSPYPGYRPLPGAVGEYNGKFMVNQYVLRGGSVATPPGHIRRTYRNFFYPGASWQFSGIRLADSPSVGSQ